MTLDPRALAAACQALHTGEPGVLRSVARVDSYPGEYPGDPEAYASIPTTADDERRAVAEVIETYLDALPDHPAWS